MSADDRTGTLGSVNIRLPHFVDGEERYRRTYKPVTPASRIVTGADDAIAPETDIASWAITDWSGGEGDVRWRDRGRYNTGTGLHPASDGSGLILGYALEEGAGQAAAILNNSGLILIARDMDDDLYLISESNLTPSSQQSIGGSAGRDAADIAYVRDYYFILDDTGDLRRVEVGVGNATWDTNSDLVGIATFGNKLYGVDDAGDLYDIDTGTASTRTKVVDLPGSTSGAGNTAGGRYMVATDTGVAYRVAQSYSSWDIYTYNYYTDTGAPLGQLPRGAVAKDITYGEGIVFVLYRYAQDLDKTFVWYHTGSQQGTIGPFPKINGTSDYPIFAGLIGTRLHLVHDTSLWVYDLAEGAIIKVAELGSLTPTSWRQATIGSSGIFLAGDTYAAFADTDSSQTSEAQTLSVGRDDYGYPGLPKLIHTVTVTTESAISGNHTVEVGYSVDGGSTTWLSDDFAASSSSHQWTVSTNSSSVIGTEVEWHLRVTSTSTAQGDPKIVGLYSDASGAKSRIEWAVAVDVDRSSTVEGEDVISALNGLKTSHAVVQWSDPFQVGPYDSAETFDVRVLDVSTPEYAEGEGLIALVKFQTVGVVG